MKRKAPKIKVKGYYPGGLIPGMSDADQVTYNGLGDADKADFLKTLGLTAPAGAADITGAGIAKAAPAIAGLGVAGIEATRGGGNANSRLNRTAEGALSGAATGLSIDAMLGGADLGAGAAIGTVVGGIGGYLKGDKEQKAADAATLAKQKAADLLNKQQHLAAAKANMNPWEVGTPGMKNGGEISVANAKSILKSGKIRGKAITKAQIGYFGLIAGGGTPNRAYGGTVDGGEDNGIKQSRDHH